MPSRNVVKVYISGGVYHIYNRGVEKNDIFRDGRDYKVFLKYLKEALSKPEKVITSFDLRGRTFKATKRPVKNYSEEISLMAYCLMPNHFHMLIRQDNKNSMTSFVRSICTRFACYFNKRYDRIGPLFQGKFKAKLVIKDNYILHLSRYIHLNPINDFEKLHEAYSSYADYIGLRNTPWIKNNFILKYFKDNTIPEITNIRDYKSFVENYKLDSKDILGKITLD